MRVIARDGEATVLEIGGRLVEGWIVEPGCSHCGGTRVYFLAYDATGCPACNRWLEVHCLDAECLHCLLRPASPWGRA